MDLKEISIITRNWVDSAQDRDYWRALGNVILNLWVPYSWSKLVNQYFLSEGRVIGDKTMIQRSIKIENQYYQDVKSRRNCSQILMLFFTTKYLIYSNGMKISNLDPLFLLGDLCSEFLFWKNPLTSARFALMNLGSREHTLQILYL